MDELDREGSNGRMLAAAGAAAAVFAAIALGLTRRKTVLAPGVEIDAPAELPAPKADLPAAATGGGADIRRLAEQVAEVAPEVIAALEQHAPDTARKLRDGLALLRRRVKDEGDAATAALEDGIGEASDFAHFRGLSQAQVAAARAAAAAVARAERALASRDKGADALRARTEGATEDIVPALREIAQQAAEGAIDLWQAARARGADAAQTARLDLAAPLERAEEALHGLAERTHDAEGKLKDRAKAVEGRVEERVERVRDAAAGAASNAKGKADTTVERVHEAADEAVDAGKEAGAAFMWLAAAFGLIFYVLLSEERREQLTRFTDEASVQLRELLRDVRGYDDEF